jgi:uncharacterized protein RhaS with RHS repeats
MGRWLSADPMGEAGELNFYGYVGGNPVNSWDPLGMSEACPESMAQTGSASKWYKRFLSALGIGKKGVGNMMKGNKWYSGAPASAIGSGVSRGVGAFTSTALGVAELGPDLHRAVENISEKNKLIKAFDDLESDESQEELKNNKICK